MSICVSTIFVRKSKKIRHFQKLPNYLYMSPNYENNEGVVIISNDGSHYILPWVTRKGKMWISMNTTYYKLG